MARDELQQVAIKVPVRMKAAIAKLAKKEGSTPHDYMLRLLREGIDRNAKWQEFIEEGRAALARTAS